jgi:hypothetical protein
MEAVKVRAAQQANTVSLLIRLNSPAGSFSIVYSTSTDARPEAAVAVKRANK